MRSMFTLALVLFSFAAHAAPELYKVETQLENDYAVAWGIPGEQIDFEELAKDTIKAQEFLDQREESTANYLVDLRSRKIVMTISQPAYVAHFNEEAYLHHNHQYWSFSNVKVNFDSAHKRKDLTAFVTASGGKWEDRIGSVIVVERENGVSRELLAESMEDKIESALIKRLAAAERVLYNSKKHDAKTHTYEYSAKLGAYKYKAIYFVPKANDPGFMLEGYVSTYVDLNRKTVKVISRGPVRFVKAQWN